MNSIIDLIILGQLNKDTCKNMESELEKHSAENGHCGAVCRVCEFGLLCVTNVKYETQKAHQL